MGKISISGDLGSGKSSVCKVLEREYGFEAYSTGAIQREIACSMGMSTYEFNVYTETHPEIDDLIDDNLKALSSSDRDMVIDSRLAWHFVKNTFKVYLVTDIHVAAQRIKSANRGPDEAYADLKEAEDTILARRESEKARYLKKYGVDIMDFSNYDMVLDTTGLSIDETAARIMAEYQETKHSIGIALR
ncbi:MAG: cytidylate kinase family protein [Clostridiales Family XIII bacterium]|jgi:cytidylate kinase|nr:cytidylate kinase family protein [Clostridiales Family XIII bacterium]